MEKDDTVQKDIVHGMEGASKKSFFDAKKEGEKSLKKPLITIAVIALILGSCSGYAAANFTGIAKKGPVSIGGNGSLGSAEIKKGATFGVSDTKAFPDTAEGTLQKGGINGEGQYHLVRPGGDSQNVYLTSSTVDLSQFEGKKVKVWGATQAAQTAGWLMDVGKLEVE